MMYVVTLLLGVFIELVCDHSSPSVLSTRDLYLLVA